MKPPPPMPHENGSVTPSTAAAATAASTALPPALSVSIAAWVPSASTVAAAPFLLAIDGEGRRAGEAIVIYCTGLGEVRPAVAAGVPAPLAPLSETIVAPVVTIGGVRAEVFYSGLTPLFAGLYQVNATVPAGVGGTVAVVVESDGRRSNAISVNLGR